MDVREGIWRTGRRKMKDLYSSPINILLSTALKHPRSMLFPYDDED
jgi:hypothetical protein